MLTYQKSTSTWPPTRAGLISTFDRGRLMQHPKKLEEAQGDLLDFIVGKLLGELLFIYCFELVNGSLA
jgi:hypothetical protein